MCVSVRPKLNKIIPLVNLFGHRDNFYYQNGNVIQPYKSTKRFFTQKGIAAKRQGKKGGNYRGKAAKKKTFSPLAE